MKLRRLAFPRFPVRAETALALGVVCGAASGATGGGVAVLIAVPVGALLAFLLFRPRPALPGALGVLLGVAS